MLIQKPENHINHLLTKFFNSRRLVWDKWRRTNIAAEFRCRYRNSSILKRDGGGRTRTCYSFHFTMRWSKTSKPEQTVTLEINGELRTPITGSGKLLLVWLSRDGSSTNCSSPWISRTVSRSSSFIWDKRELFRSSQTTKRSEETRSSAETAGQTTRRTPTGYLLAPVDNDKNERYFASSDVSDLNFEWWLLETDAERMTHDLKITFKPPPRLILPCINVWRWTCVMT